MNYGSASTRRVLFLATGSVVAGLLVANPLFAASPTAPQPYSSLIQIKKIIPNPAMQAAVNTSISALPVYAPPINGFIPQVVFGLSDEFDNDDFSFSAHTSNVPAVGHTLPESLPPHYETAIFDIGSSSHIITLDAFNAFDVIGANREGDTPATIIGAGGSETVDISDALGIYATGFANATVTGGSTLGIKPGTLSGQYNVSILSTEGPPSIVPNLIGSPMVAQYQTSIRNSQMRTLTVGGNAMVSPSVDFSPVSSSGKVPGGYYRLDLSPQPTGGFLTPPAYLSSGNLDDLGDNPTIPTWWAALMASGVNATHTTDQTRSFTNDTFLVDTGAQVTVFSQSTAGSVGYFTGGPNPSTPDFFVDVGGAGGVVQSVPGFYLDQLSVDTNGGPVTWQHVPVIVMDIINPATGSGAVPGILGTNLFNNRDLILNNIPNGAAGAPFLAIGPEFREWAATDGGNWSDSTKWSTGEVPNSIDIPAVFRSAITAPATVNIDANFTAGSLVFDSPNSYTLSGTGRITLQTTADSDTILGVPASIWVGSGTHTISAPMTFASDTAVTVDSASAGLNISNDVSATGVTITKLGAGPLNMKNVRAASLAVNGGRLAILTNGSATGVSKIGTLSVASGALLDITNNKLIVGGSNTGTFNGTQYTGVTGMIASARNGGAWNGTTGITSSSITSGELLHNIGVASAADILSLSGTNTATWNGQTVGAADTLVMYTYGGDANLDGKINIDDYGRIDGNVGLSGTVFGWYNGDFNYDGKINIDDYGIIDGNIGIQGAPLSAAALPLAGFADASVTAVPEPASLGILTFAGFVLLRRKRKVPTPR